MITKTTLSFAGQGVQELRMVSDLYERYPIVREIFKQASGILGYDVRELTDNEKDKPNRTRYTQSVVLTTSVVIFRLLQEKGYRSDMVVGPSLGECSALVASGTSSSEDAAALVAKRGELTETATPASIGKMVAITNTEASLIEEIYQKTSSKGIVTPVNYNTPARIVIGREAGIINYVVGLLEKAGVEHLVPSKVSRPFHTALP